jgi:hypothetical protein
MRLATIFLIFLMISSCGQNREKAEQKEESARQDYLQKGGGIANMAQSELLKNVAHAMKTGDPGYAIDFCNLRALSIKDSLSNLKNCEIRRIAIKYRNPVDKPQTKTEEDQLERYLIAHQKGDTLKPEVYLFDHSVEYYQPILINNGACLLCHGIPGTQIADKTLQKIKAQYPNDLATGFAMNDFRGAWKITFPVE